MDFALTEQQELIRKEVAALARSFSLDYWLEKDRKHEYPHEFVKAFAENGWVGLMIPEAYGGAGLGGGDLGRLAHPLLLLPSRAGGPLRHGQDEAARAAAHRVG